MDKGMEIIIGSDHAGFKLKEYIKKELLTENYKIEDIGTFSEESMNYPDIAHKMAGILEKNESKKGILICGTGNGMAMAANKHKKIRAALCWNREISKFARLHNNANVIVLPGWFVDYKEAVEMVKIFFNTGFEGGRHEIRVNKI